jgi:ketosteroid isomerase-like protein
MPAKTATAPAEVITLFAAALHDGRLDDALALYEPDAVFIPEPGAEPLHGTEQIRAALAGTDCRCGAYPKIERAVLRASGQEVV